MTITAHTLTDRQQQVLDVIRKRTEADGYAPTLREIGDAVGISSPNGVNCHLDVLEGKGFIRRVDFKARSITIVDNRLERMRKALIETREFVAAMNCNCEQPDDPPCERCIWLRIIAEALE